jgi:hypothetical protein
MSAKFIKNDDNTFLCNICAEKIETNNAIGLKCSPKKHIFCYECILDWYKELNKNKNTNNYTIRNMCPICRKNGGLLPIHNNFKVIKGIHDIKKDVEPINEINKLNINPDKLSTHCGAKLKTKDGYCMSIGKKQYGGFCGKHSYCNNTIKTNVVTTDIVTSNVVTVTNDILIV